MAGCAANSRSRDRRMAATIAEWFRASQRALPWRTSPRDPYRSLVAETMLQQTQVARVVEKYEGFLQRFPDVESLSRAAEQDVLAAWSGLGYYRRARNLHRASRRIVEDLDGRVPDMVDELKKLPGVGRYTAGAIASIVFEKRAALVDGNVARVLLRLEGMRLASDDRGAEELAWRRAEELVVAAPAADVAALNEGLMELGAVVCKPVGPRCGECPLRRRCAAHRAGTQDEIPLPKARAKRREVFHTCVVARDSDGRVLVAPRSEDGLWAGMFQPPTIENEGGHASVDDLALMLPSVEVEGERQDFTHHTTHRIVQFGVHRGRVRLREGAPAAPSRWLSRDELAAVPLSNPHRRMLLEE